MNSLPVIVDVNWIEKISNALTYAAVSNDAKILKIKLKEACHNYPTECKTTLAITFQSQNANNNPYVKEIKSLLE